jgi:hypothetical protein
VSDRAATVRYRRPGTSAEETVTLDEGEELVFGRAPVPAGIVLDADDLTISSRAGQLLHIEGVWLLANMSSYATLRLAGNKGFRYVHPGDRIAVADGDVVIVPADRHDHRLTVSIPSTPAPTPGGQTRPVGVVMAPLSQERRAAVAALVAGWFLTDRFDPVPLTSAEIADLLSSPHKRVTQKAVNNKLQRVRDVLSEAIGVPIDTRHMLADLVIQHRLVDIEDVRALPGLR